MNELLKETEFKPTYYLPLEEAKARHEVFNYLDTFERTDVCIGESLEDFDKEKTALLRELGAINARRREILEELLK